MKINYDDSLNFKKLYVVKNLESMQKSAAYSISKKLLRKNPNGVRYIDAIKNLGYDVLIIKTEFKDPESVRVCIIKDMEKQKQADGEYDYLDAKIICESGKHFSAEDFYRNVVNRTIKKPNVIVRFKQFISGWFN